jgi:F0F1-type ATP synthase membrane subunit b/b'
LASGLATLVETEARLDLALAQAREAAQGLRHQARQRAENAAALLDAEITRERAHAAAQVEAETQARLATIAEHARAELARYEAVRGEVLGTIVKDLVERLVVLALEVPT